MVVTGAAQRSAAGMNDDTNPRLVSTGEVLRVLPALERGEAAGPFCRMTVSASALAQTTTRERASARAEWARGEGARRPSYCPGARRLLVVNCPRDQRLHSQHELLCIAQREADGAVRMCLFAELVEAMLRPEEG